MIYRVDSDWEAKIASVDTKAFGDLYVYSKVDAENKKVPTWGNVQFSVSYPIPDGVYSGEDAQGIWQKPVGENFFDGRYRGITRFRTIGSQEEKYSSRVFYLTPEGRFSSNIAASFGESEETGKNINASSFKWLTPVAKGENKFETLPPETGNSGHQQGRLRFDFVPSEGNEIGGTLELVSFEILQYQDTIQKGNYHRFLILHFVAINCENKVIEKISQSLSKFRNKLKISSGEEVQLLPKSADFINLQLNGDGADYYDFAFARGGYLQPKVKFAEESRKRSNIFASPMRVVCAIPNVNVSDIDQIPSSFGPYQSEAIGRQSKGAHLLWGSQMLNGYDIFPQEMPTPETIISSSRNEQGHANWDFVVDKSGVSAIRKYSSLVRDMNVASLSPTRYIDLLILLQRTYMSLRVMGEELRNIERVEHQSFGTITADDMQELRAYRELLLKPVNQLLKVRNDFAEIRKTLWFNAIPRRTLDTFLMLQLRDEMGVEGLYNDLVDEVQYRQEIYNLTYHEHDSNLRSLEAQQAEDEREEKRIAEQHAEKERQRQRNEAEEKEQQERDRQAERDRDFNFVISIVAIALAVPSYVALVVEDGIGKYGWVLLGVGVALSILITAIIFGVRSFLRKNKEKL